MEEFRITLFGDQLLINDRFLSSKRHLRRSVQFNHLRKREKSIIGGIIWSIVEGDRIKFFDDERKLEN